VTRWLGAILALLLVIGAGWLVFMNSEPVTVRVTPHYTYTPPLAGALLAAFAGGALVIGLFGMARAGTRSWRTWRTKRRARREARRHAVTDQARQLVWAGEYGQARATLLRDDPGVPADAARLALLAEAHLHDGDVVTARRVLEHGMRQEGVAMNPHLLALLAEATERGADLAAAAEALEQARRLLPQSPRLARRLREVYLAAQRWSDALHLQGDILLGVRDPAVLAEEERVLRGVRYQAALGESDTRTAARHLSALAREDPRFLPAWVSAGDLYARAGRPVAARRIWERGLRHLPSAVLLDRLERLATSQGRPERMTRVYRRVMRRHRDATVVPLLFARHLITRGALDDAAELLAGLPSTLEGHPLPHALWGELHRRRGNDKLAAESFSRAVGLDLGLLLPFRCDACRQPADAWTGFCEACRRWGTYRAEAEGIVVAPVPTRAVAAR
jgi:tetratricopeptide (TPR) repeat protein